MSLIRARYRAVNTIMNLPRGGGYVGLLDLFPNAAAAYSLRLLRKNYSGGLARVRAWDGVANQGEAEIMPRRIDAQNYVIDLNSKLEDLDATAISRGLTTNDTLADLVLSGTSNYDGLVSGWRDQALSNDATQSTAANQPKIVSAGSLVTENGKAAIDFDGVNDALIKSSFNITGTSAISSFSVGFGVDSPSNGVFSIQGVIGGADGYVQTTETAIRTGGGYAEFGLQSAINSSLVSTFFPSGSDISDILCFINGSSSSRIGLIDNTIDLGANTTFTFGLGAVTYFDGIVQEVILFNSDQSANRTGIETNINNFYSIY